MDSQKKKSTSFYPKFNYVGPKKNLGWKKMLVRVKKKKNHKI